MYTGIGNWGIAGNWVGWGWLRLFVGLVIFAGIIIGCISLVLWVVHRVRSSGITAVSGSGPLTAKEILQARFARGEITHEQYERMLNDIA